MLGGVEHWLMGGQYSRQAMLAQASEMMSELWVCVCVLSSCRLALLGDEVRTGS
jgi:hypothetical protein